MLEIPAGATGLVVLAHGSRSSQMSLRSNYVAQVLHERGLGTLLFDLLTEEEDKHREAQFDIPLLSERLSAVTEWLHNRSDTHRLRLGYFGASTVAAAALRAAAGRPEIAAVVSRGGRVDMATDVLDRIESPCLFIVGGSDREILRRNWDAYDRLCCEKQLYVVDGAGHLFEGEEQLEEVARVAGNWFVDALR